MDIYQRRSRWKIVLTFAAVFIVAISLVYTNILAEKLAQSDRYRVELWAKSILNTAALGTSTEVPFDVKRIISQKLDSLDQLKVKRWSEDVMNQTTGDMSNSLAGAILFENKDIPAILTDELGNIQSSINLDPDREDDMNYLERQLEIMKKSHEPIVIQPHPNIKQMVYFKNTWLLNLLTYFPYFQVVMIAILLLVGYWAFSQARRAEQNQVWVGMAKETAHQLGTPLSSLVAWIEHLKMATEGDEETQEIIGEFRKDLGRLELVAERFSKIGSKPSLQDCDINMQLAKTFKYMKRRASRKVEFVFPENENPQNVRINPPLFDWVIENLVKNALDALDGKGQISGVVTVDNDTIYIDIADTGKGIPPGKLRTIFEPGFTTKKRGWGLGLSLTKRIIENYHSGKIFVKSSVVNKGTTFRITLPKKLA